LGTPSSTVSAEVPDSIVVFPPNVGGDANVLLFIVSFINELSLI
jgi:hypothetical protein